MRPRKQIFKYVLKTTHEAVDTDSKVNALWEWIKESRGGQFAHLLGPSLVEMQFDLFDEEKVTVTFTAVREVA